MAIRLHHRFPVQDVALARRVLLDFGTEDAWVSTLRRTARDTDSPQPGTIRTCDLASPAFGRDTIQEELVRLHADGVTYRVLSHVPTFRLMENSMRVEGRAGPGWVIIDGRFQPRGVWRLATPLLALGLRRFARQAERDLQAYIAAGAPRHEVPA